MNRRCLTTRRTTARRLCEVGLFLLTLYCLFPAISVGEDPAWLTAISTPDAFDSISVDDTSRPDLRRTTKFLAPASDDEDLLHTVYQNVNLYPLHFDFMVAEFPQRFAGLTQTEYLDLVYYPQSRTYFAGGLFRFQSRDGQIVYGFTIYSPPNQPLNVNEVQSLYQRLSETMTLRPFAYSPMSPQNIEQAKRWQNPWFPIYLPEGLSEPEYEAYSPATNYGRIRLFSLDDFEEAVEGGQVSWQDIVVIDRAPGDIQTVVAGVFTGTRQGELSHVNVRALRRGTPNAYVKDPLQVFRSWEGQLVKVVVAQDEYKIENSVDLAEAEQWWNEHRPQLPSLPDPDDEFDEMVSLTAMEDLEFSDSLIQRFGGKTTGMAKLYTVFGRGTIGNSEIPFLVKGFGIPFYYYVEFMRTNTIPHPKNPGTQITYEQYIELMLEDPRFRSDTRYRHARLEFFREYMRQAGIIQPEVVGKIVTALESVYGTTSIKLRFRSSSNAEDDIRFSGAGLYESTSVCIEDNFDGDDEGPSLCDPTKDNERTIERGLKKVWASLWLPRAFEEREYYQIDHLNTRMGILVTPAFPAEEANGVAFTGDPATGRKDYYVINVQKGDESVVQPGTGIIPEKDLVYIEYGFAANIHRARQSSIVEPGEWVLTDEQIYELSDKLSMIENAMPIEEAGYNREQICFDAEFKFDEGQLFIKQVRPMLMVTGERPPTRPDEVVLRVPKDTRMAGMFVMGRTIEQEHQLLSMLHFNAGVHSLPVEAGEYEFSLIEKVELGPEAAALNATEAGQLYVEAFDIPMNGEILRYQYEQEFWSNADRNERLTIRIQGLGVLNENKIRYEITLDKPLMVDTLNVRGEFGDSRQSDYIDYSWTEYDEESIILNEYLMEDGQAVRLYKRYLPRFFGMGVAHANLVFAQVKIAGGERYQSDYWKLVYAAKAHCSDEKFWVLFDEPVGEAYGVAVLTESILQNLEVSADVYLLDKNLQHLRKIEVTSRDKREVDAIPDPSTSVHGWQSY